MRSSKGKPLSRMKQILQRYESYIRRQSTVRIIRVTLPVTHVRIIVMNIILAIC